MRRDISWTVGLYEGEGTAFLSKSGGTHVGISNKDRWLLRRLVWWFGGRIHRAHHEVYEWLLHGDDARARGQFRVDQTKPRRKKQARRAVAGSWRWKPAGRTATGQFRRRRP